MKNWDKARIILISVSVLIIIIALYIQLNGQSKVSKNCSYLDPMIIDILAFLAALFLVVECIYRIFNHKNVSWKRQATRILRVWFCYFNNSYNTIFT